MSKVERMMRSLNALQLELPAAVVADVREAVLDVYIEQSSQIAAMHEAIKAWSLTGPQCVDDWGTLCGCANGYACKCGAQDANAARERARRAAGLED